MSDTINALSQAAYSSSVLDAIANPVVATLGGPSSGFLARGLQTPTTSY